MYDDAICRPAWDVTGRPCFVWYTVDRTLFNSAEFPRTFIVATGYTREVEPEELERFWHEWARWCAYFQEVDIE